NLRLDHLLSKEAKDMESRNAKRSIQSKRKHTEKLCLVLRVVPQRFEKRQALVGPIAQLV
ncbi:hypothetical protein CP367_10290, partial [Lactobacillus sp. UMNPBX16]